MARLTLDAAERRARDHSRERRTRRRLAPRAREKPFAASLEPEAAPASAPGRVSLERHAGMALPSHRRRLTWSCIIDKMIAMSNARRCAIGHSSLVSRLIARVRRRRPLTVSINIDTVQSTMNLVLHEEGVQFVSRCFT